MIPGNYSFDFRFSTSKILFNVGALVELRPAVEIIELRCDFYQFFRKAVRDLYQRDHSKRKPLL